MPWAFVFLFWSIFEAYGKTLGRCPKPCKLKASLSGQLFDKGGSFVDTITSRSNPLVRAAAALLGSPRERRERREFLCEGARLCRDAAESGVRIKACFFTPRAGERYGEYLKPILHESEAAYTIEDPVAGLLSDTKSPQGVFCLCAWPEGGQGAHDGPCLVLENIQDPGNLGTTLRTAEALGRFRVVLLGDCCDPLGPKALRASMGAVFRLGIETEGDPGRLMERLKDEGYAVHGAVPSDRALEVTGIDFTRGRHAVVIGNEGSGLSRETAGLCGDLITIPMGGRAESLNAAAAATVLLWELSGRGEGRWRG